MKENFKFFGLISLCYAGVYTFCLYQNASGVTLPFLVIGTVFVFRFMAKKLNQTYKKESLFLELAIILIGIATFLTADVKMVILNYCALFVLFVTYMMKQFMPEKLNHPVLFLKAFLGVVFGTVGSLPAPFRHFNAWIKSKESEKKHKFQYVLLGLVIAVPLVIIILSLLSTADVIFANLLEGLWKNVVIPEHFFGILCLFLFALFGFYCFFACLTKEQKEIQNIDKKGEPVIAITFMSVVTLIYLVFCGIQILYLFIGKMQLPEGYSYAMYAREGFFQLVTICLINVALVLFCLFYYRENRILKLLLTIISACTYILIASSVVRMALYIQEYRLTFLRIFVLWALAVIFLVMTGLVITLKNENFRLIRYIVISVTILYVGFAFCHPDYIIAKYNYEANQEREDAFVDAYYITELSSDAAPVILNYSRVVNAQPEENNNYEMQIQIDEYFKTVAADGNKMSFRTFNLSKYFGAREAKIYQTQQ